jgi:two-component system cell cycle sensor histidine kinase/response regulator CckA
MLSSPSTPRANVLIVDHDAGVRDVCATLLRELGYGAREAQNGQQALESLHAEGAQVELVLVDVETVATNDGLLLEDLRRERPDLRVLLMSGHPRTELKRFLGNGHAHAVIQKPFRMSDLDQSLGAALAST